MGLSFDILDQHWHWCNGEDLDFTWWAAGEPSDTVAAWISCGQLLGYPVADVAGRWAALSCDTVRPYVCQLPASEYVEWCLIHKCLCGFIFSLGKTSSDLGR